jgi:DNA-binding FadR family transcriptional regulator
MEGESVDVVTAESYNHGMNLGQLPPRAARAEAVIERLRQQIVSGAWPVGTKIPTEPELVASLGVARNTVREAVRALAHNGLLDIRQGSGTYVVATSELAAVMQRRFAGAETRHVAELRSALEGPAAGLAALRRTEEDVVALDAALARREDTWSRRDTAGFVDTDTAFHLAVVAASHNPVLTALYADLVEVVRDFLRADVGPELHPEAYVDHGRLVEAIRDRDAETAASEAGSHAFVWEHAWSSPGGTRSPGPVPGNWD